MQQRRVVAAVAGCLVAMAIAGHVIAQEPTRAAVRLEVARQLEKVGGDVRAAMREYEAIAEQSAQDDRAVAAEAWLLLASAHETLGDGRARVLYERVANEFRDEPTAAARATAWLRTAAPVQGEVSRRRLKTGPGERVSPDGHYVAYSADLGRKLAVEDLVTGNVKTFDQRAFAATFSPDSSEIAYNFCEGERGALMCQVRVATHALADDET